MISVVLPAYNEEDSIVSLIESIQTTAKKHFSEPVRVIVVDDGSTDGMVEKLSEFEEDSLILVRHKTNKGLGEAIKSGLIAALSISGESDTIVTMDADNTHSPGLMTRMVLLIEEGNDVVIASRYRTGSRVIGLSLARQIYSLVMSLMFRILFHIPGVRDYSSGYRAYRVSVVKKAFQFWGDEFIDQTGFSCMVDILLKLRKMDVVFSEIPLVLRYDKKAGSSKMDVKKTILVTLKLAIKEVFSIGNGDTAALKNFKDSQVKLDKYDRHNRENPNK
jgi:dolichol-phosphate mannosyltransferase